MLYRTYMTAQRADVDKAMAMDHPFSAKAAEAAAKAWEAFKSATKSFGAAKAALESWDAFCAAKNATELARLAAFNADAESKEAIKRAKENTHDS